MCTLTLPVLSVKILGELLSQSLPLTSPARSTICQEQSCDLPVTQSAYVTLQGRLLAIGGCNSKNTPTSDVHIYHPTSNKWQHQTFCTYMRVPEMVVQYR